MMRYAAFKTHSSGCDRFNQARWILAALGGKPLPLTLSMVGDDFNRVIRLPAFGYRAGW